MPKTKKYQIVNARVEQVSGGPDIPFGVQLPEVEPNVRADGAVGVIGVGLYKNYQVLVDWPNRRLVLGRY